MHTHAHFARVQGRWRGCTSTSGRELRAEGSKRRDKAESKPIRCRETSAQPYEDRILTCNLDTRTVSIWTLAGRLKGIPSVCSDEAMKLSSASSPSAVVGRAAAAVGL